MMPQRAGRPTEGPMGVLDGKVVVVTGAGQGIGREEALACARGGGGAPAAGGGGGVGRAGGAGGAGRAAAIGADGGRALALEHDVGDFEAGGGAGGRALRALGGVGGGGEQGGG